MENKFIIRSAKSNDIWNVYKLANGPDVRAVSFHQESINPEEHKIWYSNKLKDPKCLMYVITNSQNQFIGNIRFDRSNNLEFTMSVLINFEFRGRGIGTQAIIRASRKILRTFPKCTIKAYALESNIASQTSLQKAGFTIQESVGFHNRTYIAFSLNLDMLNYLK